MVKDVMNFITQSDPEVGKAIEAEYARQKRNIELIASENIVSRSCYGGNGKHPDQQVRRRLSRPSATTAAASASMSLKISPSKRAKELFGADHASVQPHSGAQRQPGCLLCTDQTGRHRSGTEPGSRRPPDPRQPGQPVRHLLQLCPIRPGRQTSASTMISVRELALEHEPKLIVAGASAYPREPSDFDKFAEIAHEVRRIPDGRYGPHRRSGCRRSAPEPGSVCGCCHHHHPQDPARSPRRSDPLQGELWQNRSTRLSSRAPRAARWSTSSPPRQSASARRSSPNLKHTSSRSSTTPQALAKALTDEGFRLVSGGTDNHLMPHRPAEHEHHRQRAGETSGRGLHHRQQERNPE